MITTTTRHHHLDATITERPWNYCVSPRTCLTERVHGGVIIEETCACGAVRFGERNAGLVTWGRWTEEEK